MILRGLKIVKYLVLFSIEVVKANWQVAKLVFSDNEKLTPAIVALPLDVKKDSQILLLSSMITLTPGTLSLDVDLEKKNLFVHVMHTKDPNQTIAEIKNGFERWIMEVFP